MKLQNLPKINIGKKTRLGRGKGSGKGKTSGRGHKGQKSRSGYNIPKRFEGGQTPIIQRSPKKGGFKSQYKSKHFTEINLDLINKFYNENETVSPESLFSKKIIKNKNRNFKILGKGQLAKKLKFQNCLMSNKIKKIIEKLSSK